MVKKLVAFFLPLACSLALSAAAHVRGSVTSTGCLQTGADPNTFVLNSDSHLNTALYTGGDASTLTPAELARVQMSYIKIVPEGNLDLQSYMGHRARVKGFLILDRTGTAGSTATSADLGQLELRVTSIRRIAGT